MYADRLAHIAPFRVMQILERARALEAEGHRVVHFEVGEPDFATAECIVEAGRQALAAGRTHYTQALGLPELRKAIAGQYRLLGVEIAPERIAVTSGASAGLLLLAALLVNPGDGWLLPDPGYPANEVFLGLVNGVAHSMPVRAESGFVPGVRDVEAAWQPTTRGLLLASPANPTGAVIDRVQLRALIDRVREKSGYLIMDEIYQGLIYGDTDYQSALQVDSELFVLNSFSKFFGMTGWRLGWLVVPEQAVDGLARLAQNLFISPSSVAQYAALAAFSEEAMSVHLARRDQFARRRELLMTGLRRLGFEIPVVPRGAFYLYADVSRFTDDSTAFCQRLLESHQVAITPGADFGSAQPERYVRFAYTTDENSIQLGLERLAAAV